jgi:EAL domain-containing protein (putative c-di-GMP-specific phosphodiesterase class I)
MGCTLGQGFLFGVPTPEGLPTFAEADVLPPEPPFPAPARAMRIDATP